MTLGHLRIALVVFIAVLVTAVVFTVRSRRETASTDQVQAIDPSASVVAPKGADIVWTNKGREIFTLSFDRSLTYSDGRSVFTGVRIRIPQADGQPLDVRAREAEVSSAPNQPRTALLRGDVVVTSAAGLKLATATATYDESSKIIRAPGEVTFSKGRMSGSGRGAVYDQAADTLTIERDARMKVVPGRDGDEPLDIVATRARVSRAEHVVRFEQGATIVAGDRQLQGDTVTAFLDDSEERITRLELRGRSRVTGAAADPGSLRLMQATDINLAYAEDGRTLDRAELRGQSVVEIAGATPAPRRLRGETIDIDLAADGTTLEDLQAKQSVVLELPEEGDTAAREIRADALRGAGTPGEPGLRKTTFLGHVEYREQRAARGTLAAIDRTAKSDRLDATLAPGFGAPEEADFSGHVSIVDGATKAESGLARYRPARDLMTLETPSGTPGAAPRVVDERVSVAAKWIEMTLGSRTLDAKGDVRSVLQPDRREAGRAQPKASGNLPTILDGDEPANVTASELHYDGATSQATYTGSARLWQGETTIQSQVMVLDDKAGNLTADKQVRTRMLLEQTDAKSGKPEQVESLGAADQLIYDDAERRATYTGNAHVSGPQGDVTARRIVLFLDKDGRTLQRAEAYDDVVARLEGGQRAYGARLTYFGADERYAMSGQPVRILETVDGGCRETIGSSLTFIRSTDTISVVGTEGNRSRTTPGRCPEQGDAR